MNPNEKQYYIYIRSTGEKVPVTKEQFDVYYHDIDIYRRFQQRHMRCVCPPKKRLSCDMDCYTCPYRSGEEGLRLNSTVTQPFENVCKDQLEDWINFIPDDQASFENLIADAEELKTLIARLSELLPEAIEVGKLRLAGESDRSIERQTGISRKAFAYRLKNVKKLLEKDFSDFF